ncbi:hypothetical protein FQR65_LT10832 [Abscondita terminalis]|nr:hypothetical protein FQR65_LT10832 [Abscondita terminalis]
MDKVTPSTSKTADLEQEENFNSELQIIESEEKPINESPGAVQLRKWLNKTLKIEMSDGRVLIGIFLCTDRDANIILGSCSEYLPEDMKSEEATNLDVTSEEPRMLGLVMVPGKHIVSIHIDQNEEYTETSMEQPLTCEINEEIIINPTFCTKGLTTVYFIGNSGNKI